MMRAMRIDDAETSLLGHLSSVGLGLDGVDAPAVMAAMMDWYAEERATDAAPIDEDGDMLLFQWGEHDRGAGRTFDYDLTRQLVRADDPEDEGILQLSLTFRYPTSDRTAGLGSGHRWCGSPAQLARLRRDMADHPASEIALAGRPREVVLACEIAG
jgi:hypothetical protein